MSSPGNSLPRRFFYPGIRTRVTFPFLLTIAVMAVISVFVVTRLVAGSVQERFNNQLLDSAQAASNTVVDVERQQLAVLRLMVFTDGVDSALLAGDTDTLSRLIQPVAVTNSVDEVLIFDAEGQGLIQISRLVTEQRIDYPTLPAEDVTGREGVQRVLRREADVLGDKYVDIIGDPPEMVFYISAPVITSEGELAGGISIGIRAETLAQRISEQALSGITLHQSSGTTISTTHRFVSLEALNLPPEKATTLIEQTATDSPIEEQVLSGTDYQVLYAPFQLRSQPIGLLAVSLPRTFLVERISTSRNIFTLLFAVLFAFIAGLGLLTARTITRPVGKLVDTTRAIRSGDLSRRVELSTPDELGELGISFDQMTDQLLQRNQEISELYVQQQEETARREAVLTSISDAVLVQDYTGKVIMQNEAATALLGRSGETVRGMLSDLSQLQEPQIIELNQYFYSVLATPVRRSGQQALGHVVVFRDITALIRAEQLKDDLMKQMSHELRTPLTAARGYVELVIMLDSAALQPQSQTFLQNAVDSMTTLERMVNQVIDVSAIISSQFHLDLETFDLLELVEERVSTWQPAFEKRQLMLNCETEGTAHPLEADRYRLGQVIDHLLRNANSYTLPGGTITVRLKPQDQRVALSIQDTGVGIDADETEAVFERMYRGRSADAGPTDARGLGLGLTLSKQIIEAHHGTITLMSQPTVGTTVTVLLPLTQKEHADST